LKKAGGIGNRLGGLLETEPFLRNTVLPVQEIIRPRKNPVREKIRSGRKSGPGENPAQEKIRPDGNPGASVRIPGPPAGPQSAGRSGRKPAGEASGPEGRTYLPPESPKIKGGQNDQESCKNYNLSQLKKTLTEDLIFG
jgi:hypothetical protein